MGVWAARGQAEEGPQPHSGCRGKRGETMTGARMAAFLPLLQAGSEVIAGSGLLFLKARFLR